MIDDFLVDKPIYTLQGVRTLDYEKIVKTTEKDFAKLYLELMT